VKKTGFTQVPNRIICSGKKLTDREFRLLCVLMTHDFQKGYVFPGREKIAKEMGASRAKVDRVKGTLEKKGAFKKKRRGQGITNIYYLNEDFFIEADNSQMSRLGDSVLSGKEKENNNTPYNYLKTSPSTKETTYGENHQPLPITQPKPKTPPDVIFLSHLKKLQVTIDSQLSKFTIYQLDKDYRYSKNTDSCVQGIIYYIRNYKLACGFDHPLYKLPQLRDCMFGFLNGIWEVEKSSIDLPTDEIVKKVIDRWFSSTSPEPNNLHLSHFIGNGSSIFSRSLEAVMADYGLSWREDSDYS
jgi:hypothetical protein